MIRAFIQYASMLPRALDLLHLRWGLAELSKRDPLHPDVPKIVRRIRELES